MCPGDLQWFQRQFRDGSRDIPETVEFSHLARERPPVNTAGNPRTSGYRVAWWSGRPLNYYLPGNPYFCLGRRASERALAHFKDALPTFKCYIHNA